MSAKYALIIANTDYTDPGLAKLSAPGKDAEGLARVLRSPEICAFDSVNVLVNEPEPVVREQIDAFFDQKKADDLLLLYFSGHGVRDEQGALYLAVKSTNRFRLRATAVKSDFIRECMDLSRSKRQVLILDCCNSGAFARGAKAVAGASVGTGSAFEGRGYGHVVLTASDSTQFAWEGDEIVGETQDSLFTHFLVKGLDGDADLNSDGRITIDELYDYTYGQIVALTPKQTPSKWSYKEQGEIVLRESIPIQDVKPATLPEELLSEIENAYPEVRLRAVQQLGRLLIGKHIGLARSAREALERIEAQDDSKRVSQAAAQMLAPIREAEQQAEEERKRKEEELRLASQKAAQEELQRQQAEAQRRRWQEAEAVRLAREEAKRELVKQQRKEPEALAAAPAERPEEKKPVPIRAEAPAPLEAKPVRRRIRLPRWATYVGGAGLVIGAGLLALAILRPLLVPAPAAPTIRVGEVTDLGGVNDKSFNASAWKGVQDAISQLGVEGKYLESKDQSDYAKNIQTFIDQDKDLIVTVGFLLGPETATAAKANPNAKFAIVDYTYPDCYEGATEGKDCGSWTDLSGNVRGINFRTDQAAFLAGYAAAGMSQTGRVGVFGGIQIPTVTIFMKGFEAGVKYYNQQNNDNVHLYGWNTAMDRGVFVGNFESTDDGRKVAEDLLRNGVDVIMPVAGPVGLGSAAVCKETGQCMIVGVDSDWYQTAPEYQQVILTSVMKRIDVAVYDTISDMVHGGFTGGTVTYSIADGGVEIAPFHAFEGRVPASLKAQIDAARKALMNGSITVDGVLSN